MPLQATKEKQDQRLKICKDCKHSRVNKIVGLTCGEFLQPTYREYGDVFSCGCNLTLKTKFFSQACPQKKW